MSLEELSKRVETGEKEASQEMARELLAGGADPLEILNRLNETMKRVGERFAVLDIFLPEVRAHSKITSHFGRRCIPSGRVAKTRNIQIFLRFRALPGGRLNAQNCELIFS
jgi:methanogenic corrinoid protein MtbC1